MGGSFRLVNIRVRLCVWYATLKRLTATRASIVQVVVPILAALGEVLFLPEIVTIQMLFTTKLILKPNPEICIRCLRESGARWAAAIGIQISGYVGQTKRFKFVLGGQTGFRIPAP